MFGKLLVIVTCLGATAAGLLTERHQRLTAARQTILLRQRILDSRQAEWMLDLQIAQRLRPESLRETLTSMGEPLIPIIAAPVAEHDGQQTLVLARR